MEVPGEHSFILSSGTGIVQCRKLYSSGSFSSVGKENQVISDSTGYYCRKESRTHLALVNTIWISGTAGIYDRIYSVWNIMDVFWKSCRSDLVDFVDGTLSRGFEYR